MHIKDLKDFIREGQEMKVTDMVYYKIRLLYDNKVYNAMLDSVGYTLVSIFGELSKDPYYQGLLLCPHESVKNLAYVVSKWYNKDLHNSNMTLFYFCKEAIIESSSFNDDVIFSLGLQTVEYDFISIAQASNVRNPIPKKKSTNYDIYCALDLPDFFDSNHAEGRCLKKPSSVRSNSLDDLCEEEKIFPTTPEKETTKTRILKKITERVKSLLIETVEIPELKSIKEDFYKNIEENKQSLEDLKLKPKNYGNDNEE
jgi:hypothetical protein